MKMTIPAAVLAMALAGAAAHVPAARAQDPAIEVGPSVPHVSVSATGRASRVPDMAVMDLSVVRQDADAAAATEAASTAMAAVIAQMKAFGVADRDLQSAGFNLRPIYDQPPHNPDGTTTAPPTIRGYEVNQSLTVRIRDLAELGAILSKAVELGVNNDGNYRLTNAEPEAILAEARKDAVRAAMQKAKTLAEAAGVTLGAILRITETAGGYQPVPMARMAMAEAKDVPIASGENEYEISVGVDFAITPAAPR